jgi:endonuclease YncB( thermonuclease family)
MRRLVLALIALFALLPGVAQAKRAPCTPGKSRPVCNFTNARVTFVADGDTIRVRVPGKRGEQTIRFTGINAMELTRYSGTASRRRGACHGVEATNMIDRLIKRSGRRVRLADQRDDSRSGERLRRSVWVRSGGRWRDLARLELERGLVLWLPNGVEWAHNAEYRQLAARAASARRGLYDPDACGRGPDDDLPLRMFVNWDADSNDSQNLNDEWVEIVNDGDRPLPLAGWWLRDSFLHFDRAPGGRRVPGYAFPAGAEVPARGSIRVRVGSGSNTDRNLFWGLPDQAFENVTTDGTALGDGAYLFDPQGDLRLSMLYPCVLNCSDPAEGRVRVDVQPNRDENVRVTNTGTDPLDLYGYLLKIHNPGVRDSFIASYQFGPAATLGPGETLRLDLAGSPSDDTRLEKHWGLGANRLRDNGPGAISLRTFTDIQIACDSWGSASC